MNIDKISEHVLAALGRHWTGFPEFECDSWSEQAVSGQWIVLEDRDGRRFQVQLDHEVSMGVIVNEGQASRSVEALVKAVLDQLKCYVGDGSQTVVSRPLPDPLSDQVEFTHVEFKGVWLRLTTGYEVRAGIASPVAVLSGVLGKGGQPLAEALEHVQWL